MFTGVLLMCVIVLLSIALITCIIYWVVVYFGDIREDKIYHATYEKQMKGDTCINIDSVNKLQCKIVDDRFITNVVNDTKTNGSSFETDAFNVSSSVSNNDHEEIYNTKSTASASDINTNGETNKYNKDVYYR